MSDLDEQQQQAAAEIQSRRSAPVEDRYRDSDIVDLPSADATLAALIEAEKLVFANSILLGSPEYFALRKVLRDGIKAGGGR